MDDRVFSHSTSKEQNKAPVKLFFDALQCRDSREFILAIKMNEKIKYECKEKLRYSNMWYKDTRIQETPNTPSLCIFSKSETIKYYRIPFCRDADPRAQKLFSICVILKRAEYLGNYKNIT